MDTRIKDKIIQLYDVRYLLPQLGEGEVRKTLVGGLDAVITEVLNIEAIPLNLNNNIDYQSFLRFANSSHSKALVKRLKHFFRRNNIHTYQDLISFTNDLLEKEEPNISDGVRDPFRKKNIGSVTLRILYSYLNSIGIQLFNEGYNSREVKG